MCRDSWLGRNVESSHAFLSPLPLSCAVPSRRTSRINRCSSSSLVKRKRVPVNHVASKDNRKKFRHSPCESYVQTPPGKTPRYVFMRYLPDCSKNKKKPHPNKQFKITSRPKGKCPSAPCATSAWCAAPPPPDHPAPLFGPT